MQCHHPNGLTKRTCGNLYCKLDFLYCPHCMPSAHYCPDCVQPMRSITSKQLSMKEFRQVCGRRDSAQKEKKYDPNEYAKRYWRRNRERLLEQRREKRLGIGA